MITAPTWRARPIFVLTALAALLLGLTTAPAFGDAPDQPDPPGTGVVCAWAIYTALGEIGRQCFPGQDPELQAELALSVAKIDAYVAANSNLSPGDIAQFKKQQGHLGDARDVVCRDESRQFYLAMRQAKVSELRDGVDAMLSRPGEPTWGTCL